MLETGRALLQRTASRLAGWASGPGISASGPVVDTIETVAETAIAGGYSAGLGVGLCLPIKTAVTAGFGYADIGDHIPVSDRSIFAVGACARQLTTVAILLLAERNMVRLNDPVARILPDIGGENTVRLQDLLRADAASEALLRRIIVHVSGQGYVDFVVSNLLMPAGMTSSSFSDTGERQEYCATAYRLKDNRAHDFSALPTHQPDVEPADFLTTTGDLLLWNRALYRGRLLTPIMMDLMMAARSSNGGSCSPVLAPYAERHGWAFGVQTARLFGRRAFWQHGQSPGFDAWLFHFPDDRTDLVLLANTEEGATTILEPMLRAILRI